MGNDPHTHTNTHTHRGSGVYNEGYVSGLAILIAVGFFFFEVQVPLGIKRSFMPCNVVQIKHTCSHALNCLDFQ